MKDTKEDYKIYLEHKKELKETPLTLKQWKEFNNFMREMEK